MARPRRKSIDQQVFERQANICKAFANPIRLRMLDILGRQDCAVSELLRQLNISKTNLSQHLAILKGAGVVVTRREGKHVVCALAVPQIKQACHLIGDVLRAQIRETQRITQ